MPGTEVYDRDYRLVVEYAGLGLEILPPFQIVFDVSKSLKPEPNKANFKIYGLNRQHRSTLEQMKRARVEFAAGYKGATSVIYLGELRVGMTVDEPPDFGIVVLETADSEAAFGTSRINTSFAKGVTTDNVLAAVATQIGVKPGNLPDAKRKIQAVFSGTGNRFPKGCVITGSASRELSAMCRSLNLEWSIQDGKLQILERGKLLEGAAILLNQRSGMICSPTIDSKGIVSVTSALQPDVFPGRQVMVEGVRLKGRYRIEETAHSGDFAGETWQVEIKGKKV